MHKELIMINKNTGSSWNKVASERVENKSEIRMIKILFFMFIVVLQLGESRQMKVQESPGDIIPVSTISANYKFDTISQATSKTNSNKDSAKSSSAIANSLDGGQSISYTDTGKAIASAMGVNSKANAQSDEGKISRADALTDSSGGIAISSALNNSNAMAQSYNGGKAISSTEQEAFANSFADGNSDATALAIDKGNANASARSKTFEIGIADQTSKLTLNNNSQSKALATASDTARANADSSSVAGSIGTAMFNGKGTTNSNSLADSNANASQQGIANSKADSMSLATANASGNSEVISNSDSVIKSDATAGDTLWNSNSNVSKPQEYFTSDESINYMRNPIAIQQDESIIKSGKKVETEFNFNNYYSDNKQSQNDDNNNNENVSNDWASVYNNDTPERYHRNKMNQNVNTIKNVEQELIKELADIILPPQVQSSSTINISNIDWTYLRAVAKDLSMNSEGDLIIAGLNGIAYRYEFVENEWEELQGNFEVTNIMKVALSYDGTPYIINSIGDTYYLDCHNKWVRLPGCAKDISIGRGGEIYKVGCETRIGGFRIYKLLKDDDNINVTCQSNSCKRYRKLFNYENENKTSKIKYTWINMDGAAININVHPNGNPFIINDTGIIKFYDGIYWKDIPNTNAIDFSISNEGFIFYIGHDYLIYTISLLKPNDDWTQIKISPINTKSASAITVGPYSQPVIISEGYKVYSSSKLGYN